MTQYVKFDYLSHYPHPSDNIQALDNKYSSVGALEGDVRNARQKFEREKRGGHDSKTKKSDATLVSQLWSVNP